MQITLVLKEMPNAPQEIKWLHDRIQEADIKDVRSQPATQAAQPGTMSGEWMTDALLLMIGAGLAKPLEKLWDLLFDHFRGKPVTIELKATCPDNGKELTMNLDTSKPEEREAFQAEFNRRYQELCSPTTTRL